MSRKDCTNDYTKNFQTSTLSMTGEWLELRWREEQSHSKYASSHVFGVNNIIFNSYNCCILH